MKYVVTVVVLGLFAVVVHGAEIAVWVMPGRFLYDCGRLPEAQKVIVRNSGLAGIGILGKCR